MTLRRQGFVAFILLTVIVCLALLPLVPIKATSGRHHVRIVIAALIPLPFASSFVASSLLTSTATEQSVLVPKSLFELHCSRLC